MRRYTISLLLFFPLALGFRLGAQDDLSDDEMLPAVTVHGDFDVSEDDVAELSVDVDSSDATDELSEDGESSDESEGTESEDPEKAAKEARDKKLDEALKQLRRTRELLSVKNSISSERLKAELNEMKEEKDRLSMENALFVERVKSELIEQRGEVERMNAEIDRLTKELNLASSQIRLEIQQELAELKKENERLDVENSIQQKKNSMELERLRVEEMAVKVRRSQLEAEYAELQGRLSIEEKREELKDRIVRPENEPYLMDPFVDGVLYVSDRRIAMNGPIWPGLSSYVSERINFFNNKSTEYPIFLVIDSSPGGSVWAGSRILTAMESSEAPVYVVVKSYAASMAAIITTLAERSYAYPNAVILHHELGWTGVTGSLSKQKEYADDAKEWWRRIATPVAEKMGVTLDEFRTLMYEKSSSGDWREFADVAQSYGWVDQVVDKIWERSIDRNPDRYGMQMWAMDESEVLKDDKGRSFVELPRLEPYDYYFLYDPANYYREAQ